MSRTTQATGESWSYTFLQTGTFDCYCVPHPWVRGKVIVKGAA